MVMTESTSDYDILDRIVSPYIRSPLYVSPGEAPIIRGSEADLASPPSSLLFQILNESPEPSIGLDPASLLRGSHYDLPKTSAMIKHSNRTMQIPNNNVSVI